MEPERPTHGKMPKDAQPKKNEPYVPPRNVSDLKKNGGCPECEFLWFEPESVPSNFACVIYGQRRSGIIPKSDTDLNSYIKDWEKDIKWQDSFQLTDGHTESDGTTKLMPWSFTRSAAHIAGGSPSWDPTMNSGAGGWSSAGVQDKTTQDYAAEMYWDRRGTKHATTNRHGGHDLPR